jgi:Zn-dependent M28 family amino/carboxypeptidase
MRRRNTVIIAGLVGALLATTQASVAQASSGSGSCNGNANTVAKIMKCVTLTGVRQHQLALQIIANVSGGNRFSGLPGHDRSVAYVVARLKLAGYHPVVQRFDYAAFEELGPSTLSRTAPAATDYAEGTDFQPMSLSDGGSVTDVAVTPVDINLAGDRANTSGCEAADFAGFPAGNVALIQRGGAPAPAPVCTFELKAENAAAAGASGVIIFNQGNTPARLGLPNGGLGQGNTSGLPVLETTFALGETLSVAGTRVSFFSNVQRIVRPTMNVFADTNTGDDTNVVVVGGHLDSVEDGPGINDNGSGISAVLETAIQMRKVKPTNTVRFAFWGAEESGLVGSNHYVANLTAEEHANIALYLNFDMIGSPNFVRFVYDGSGDAFGLAGPPGSAAIEDFFNKFYADRGLAFEPTEISFRSDYAAFFNTGIPFGGLFTGAEAPKTEEQAAIYGGTVGAQLDPCYHAECDTFDNVNRGVLDLNSDGVAAATLTYAMSTETVDAESGAVATLRASAAAAPSGTATE